MKLALHQKVGRVLAAAALALTLSPLAGAQSPRAPVVRSAIDGILDEFRGHPIVAISNAHGMAQGENLWIALVRDPRFASQVGNIVIEGVSRDLQSTIDRYVNGDYVPYLEMRRLWQEGQRTTSPGILISYHPYFYVAVREANAKLSPEKRIKVWAGEPPAGPTSGAGRIIDDILSNKKKALVLFGSAHLRAGAPNLRGQVEDQYPNSFVVLSTYVGMGTPACSERFEQSLRSGPTPALLTSIRGSTLEAELRRPECTPPSGSHAFGPDAAVVAARQAAGDAAALNLLLEGLLYVGPSASLTRIPGMPELYLDLDYRDAVAKRNPAGAAQPGYPPALRANPLTPAPFAADTALQPRPMSFRANDLNGDAKLDKSEHRQALIQVGIRADQVDKLLVERDLDKDGFITLEEYTRPIQ